jgi:DNA-binding cell septation regulator SpoVG
MQFPVEVNIEPSKSGKTFGIALVKADKVLLAIKNCKLASCSNGQFVSGPSSKMDDGTWFNYLFMDKQFGEYVTGLAVKAMSQPAQQRSAQAAPPLGDDIPFAKRADY